jgi:hypothetical protein
MQRLLVRGAYVAESQVPVPLSDLPRRFYRTRSARVATHPAHGRTSRLLDDERKRETLPYIERLRDELSIPIVYVSHRLAEVQCLTGHIVRLDAGRVAVIMSFSCSLRVNSTRLRPTPIEDDASTCRFFETNGCVRVSETGCAMATVGAKQPGGGKWPKAERLLLDCFAAKRTLILVDRSAVSAQSRHASLRLQSTFAASSSRRERRIARNAHGSGRPVAPIPIASCQARTVA